VTWTSNRAGFPGIPFTLSDIRFHATRFPGAPCYPGSAMTPQLITPLDRAAINRANSQHSTGPKTQAGKQRSSLNALRHGLTGQIIVLPGEDLEAYRSHVDSFIDEYHPQGATETHLVQSLADTAWRQNRVAALENNLLTLGIVREPEQLDDAPEQVQQALSIAAALDSQTRALANLSLHGQRLSRQFEKTLAKIQELQSARLERENEELDRAATLVHAHALQDEPYDPSEDGFVFSTEQIEAVLHGRDLAKRLDQAEDFLRYYTPEETDDLEPAAENED